MGGHLDWRHVRPSLSLMMELDGGQLKNGAVLTTSVLQGAPQAGMGVKTVVGHTGGAASRPTAAVRKDSRRWGW